MMLNSVNTEEQISQYENERIAERHGDRLEALMNLAFLMRNDIERPENLRSYLQLMDGVLKKMTEDFPYEGMSKRPNRPNA
jgi:hypothetical protein